MAVNRCWVGTCGYEHNHAHSSRIHSFAGPIWSMVWNIPGHLFLVLEGAWRAKIWSHVRSPGLLVTSTAFSVLILASGGIYYAFEWLTPMLLDYLQKDAQAAGLTTEWRLNGFIGFILNLSVACAIGFQAPVLTLLAIRTDLVKLRRCNFAKKAYLVWNIYSFSSD